MASGPSNTSLTSSFARRAVLRALGAAPKLQESKQSSIAKLSDTLIVKYGSEVHLWEARNMMFAASIPGVRVPRLHDAWEEEDRSLGDEAVRTNGYLVMDYVPGRTLRSAWSAVGPETRADVYRQLSESIAALHNQQLTRPGPVGGGISKGFYFTAYDAGPFETVHHMEQWFNERQRVCKDLGHVYENEPDFSGTFNQLVMCHMDLHMDNLILDSYNYIWVLDWSRAGGCPVFFEEAQLKISPDPENLEFSQGLLKVISTGAHTKEVEHLRRIGYAVTTGWLLKPRVSQHR